MDAHGFTTCEICGSKFRLNYTHVFPSVHDSIRCLTCAATLHYYHEPRSYVIESVVEIRHDNEPQETVDVN